MLENDGLDALIDELDHFALNANSYQDDSGYAFFLDDLLSLSNKPSCFPSTK